MITGVASDTISVELNDIVKNRIERCFGYIAGRNLKKMPVGRYEIEGEDIFMNLEEFETSPAEGRDFEAHRKYMDLFYVVEGEEGVDVSDVYSLRTAGYSVNNDRESLSGEVERHFVLKKGDYIMLFPQDAHRPGICEGEPQKIKKAVFKIAIH